MKFFPHDRILDLLVGEELYTSGDAAVRELLQNAEDACGLQKLVDPEYEPRIVVRFSREGGWTEVEDNGRGMDDEVLTKSFIAVGADRTDVSSIRELLEKHPEDSGRQIAQFGIGILSCFGVADSIELHTKMAGSEGLAYRINNYHDDFVRLGSLPSERGTRIRLYLKQQGAMSVDDVPDAAKSYARHAPHVFLEDVDEGEVTEVLAEWVGADADGALEVDDPFVSQGFLALDPAWGREDVVAPRVVLCNGGFLVSDQVDDLLPPEAVGYIGELDLVPKSLRILMNREGFKKDASWEELQGRLLGCYRDLVVRYVSQVTDDVSDGLDEESRKVATRRLMVLLKGPTAQILGDALRDNIREVLSEVVLLSVPGRDVKVSVADVVRGAHENEQTIYAVRSEKETQRFESRDGSGDATLRITEVARADVRVHLLQAKGAPVVRCKRQRFHERIARQNVHVDAHEFDVLTAAGGRSGVPIRPIEKATPAELELNIASESALISQVLELDTDLKVAHLPKARGRVVRDYSSRLLNTAHPEVQRILRILPKAVGNPVRRKLLQVYMELANHQIATARDRVVELLVQDDLEEEAALKGGPLQSEYMTRCLAAIVTPHEEAE